MRFTHLFIDRPILAWVISIVIVIAVPTAIKPPTKSGRPVAFSKGPSP